MSPTIGRRLWTIAEICIPSWSNDTGPQFTSHEMASNVQRLRRGERVRAISADCSSTPDEARPVPGIGLRTDSR
jgi:hypothetical protein